MNEIQRLIHEMCPDGVPMVALGEIGSLIRGNGLQKKDFVDHGVGCIHYGQIYTRFGLFTDKTLAYVSESLANKLTQVESGNLVIACTSENVEDVCKCVAWLGDNTIVTGGHAVVFKHSQNPKYIAYCFTSEDFQTQKRKYAFGAKVIDIKIDKLASIQIPLPPLPIQQRIVEILDKFTSLVSSLDSEISLRQKQYEYYRNKLLSFEEEDTEYIKLGKLCQIRNGYTPSKTNLEYWTNGTIPWFRIEDIRQNGRILSDAIQHITEIAVKKGGPFKENSVIVSTTATIGEHAIITVPFVCNQQITILTPFEDSVLPKYLYYCGYLIGEWCKNNVNGAGLAIIPSNKLTECEIPVPSLDRQLSIVRTLDTFESLLTNLKKERELRQKQYEYYREKLLTFA